MLTSVFFFSFLLFFLFVFSNQGKISSCNNTRRQNRCCRFDVTTRKRGRFTENLSIYLSSPAPNSPLQNPSNFGATSSHWLLYFLLFFFFLILTGWIAWSLMRGDAFIHFVSGSRRVNIRLGVLLLIPKSPQYIATRNSGAIRRILREKWISVRVSRLPLKKFLIFNFFFFFCVCPANPLFLQKDWIDF